MLKSSEEYAKTLGVRCPVCNNDDTEGSSFDTEHGFVLQKIWCHDCGSEWYDRYELTGYQWLELPEEDQTTGEDDASRASHTC